jgi:hypothetical protein
MPEEELPLYLHWVKFLDWLLSRTEKFPRRVRLSLSNRLENLALDFSQDLVEARYTRDKTATLRRMNLRLERTRVLLRLCHDRRLLTPEGYEKEPATLLTRTAVGVPFLGLRVFPGALRLRRRKIRRCRDLARRRIAEYLAGERDEASLQASLGSIVAHVEMGGSPGLRRAILMRE